MRKILVFFFLFLCSSSLFSESGLVRRSFKENGQVSKDSLLAALTEELNRSFSKLKHAEKVPLYFLEYEVFDSRRFWIDASLGAVSSEGESNSRILTIDVRLGSREMDNTHEIKGRQAYLNDSNSRSVGSISLPGGDVDAIKEKIWLLTDREYKRAHNNYLKVEMNKKVTASEEDESGDFTCDKTTDVYYDRAEMPLFEREKIKNLIKKLSLKFKEYDFLLDSGVGFYAKNLNRYIVNSDGAQIVTGNNYMQIYFNMSSRTEDGMNLSRYKSYHFENAEEMPGAEQISRDIDTLLKQLARLRKSSPQEPFIGPAILEGQAAAVFFHEIFGHRIEGHRQKSASEGQTFSKKVGKKIMPEFLSIYDDPSIKKYNGTFLRGNYVYDDEGVKSQRTSLVENGILKGFLMSRIPIDKFNRSNGHGRRSEGRMPVARQGNLIVESSRRIPRETLRKKLVEEIKKSGKPYGLIIKDIAGGFTITKRTLPQSFTVLIKYALKIFPDGRPEEVVRGPNMIGTPLQTFQKIVYTSDDPAVFNGTCGAESGWVPVSAVSPSLLFSEIETEKVQKSNEKPPVLKPPYFERRNLNEKD